MSVGQSKARPRGRVKGLSPKQQRFCIEYAADPNGNATQAAIRAGYAAKSADVEGCRLLGHAKINEEIDRLKAKHEENPVISYDWWIQALFRNYRRAIQAEPVRDKHGRETGKYVYQGGVANRALELIGKGCGFLTEKMEITQTKNVNVTVRHDLARLTEQELSQLESLLGRASQVIDVEAKPKEITGESGHLKE